MKYVKENIIFFKNRVFSVRTNGQNSHQRTPEKSIPQGSVLSPTLFILAEKIVKKQKSPVHYAIYVDYKVIFCLVEVELKHLS